MIRPRLAALVLLLPFVLVLGPAAPCLGWGADGHQITGVIAWRHLDPATRAVLDDLLADDEPYGRDAIDPDETPERRFGRLTIWADQIKRDPRYRWASPLHYVNLPSGADEYDAARDCPEGTCVTEAIRRYTAVLGDESKPRTERVEALKFLIHFVGDVHQPLHAGYGHDRGGNDVRVDYFGSVANLHRVWDTSIIRRAHSGWVDYADVLDAGVSEVDATLWSTDLDPTTWTMESFNLVESMVYDFDRSTGRLEDAYHDRALPVIERRLRQAGIRMAALLDETLRPAD